MNRQSGTRVDLADARRFARRLRSVLELRSRRFDVSFVSDRDIGKLNKTYRNTPRATDVLSFPWEGGEAGPKAANDFRKFLGDVVISPQRARRNALDEGHSLRTEIRWLMLHGVLHLLGYDHEADSGEMVALELGLRDRLNGRIMATRRRKS